MKLTQNLRNVIERKILCMAAHSVKNIDNMFRLRRKETKELGICVGRLSIELGYVAVKWVYSHGLKIGTAQRIN